MRAGQTGAAVRQQPSRDKNAIIRSPMKLPLQIAILAAGKGKRMHSALPKVLHPLGGKPLLAHVLATARAMTPRVICIVEGAGDAVRKRFPDPDLNWARQDPPRGTGDALRCALAALPPDGVTLVMFGADPLAREATLREVVEHAERGALSLLTIDLDDPSGYGRIVRSADGRVAAIVEHKDATLEQQAIREINTGVMAAPTTAFAHWPATIDVGCIFEGGVTLGDNVAVGSHCVLRNVKVGNGTAIAPFSHIEDASIGAQCRIGPYARIRPATVLADHVHIGNFVEVKASAIGVRSKVNHLTYVGDSTVGRDVNIGAGTITCNYDGANKHRTIIEDDVHIGSDTQLVAPVTIGRGATIGAGTTVWKDVPPDALAMNEKTQVARSGWKRPKKG